MANLSEGQRITMPCAAASGIVARRCVVFDATTHGNVKLPAGTPELTFAGVAYENASANNNVGVTLDGLELVESDGSAVINPGDDLIVVGTTGRVKSKSLVDGATVYEIVGKAYAEAQVAATAGLVFAMLIAPYKLPAT